MRHRITSFRCVEAGHSMLWFVVINKTCISSQFRQSSMLRAASGQAGIARIGPAPSDIRNLPRLNAIASSSGSLASKRPPRGSVRMSELVANVSGPVAAPELGRVIVTVRVVRSHRRVTAEPNDASDPPAVGIYDHWPGASGSALPGSNDSGATWAAAGEAAASRTTASRIICRAYRPWPGVQPAPLSAWPVLRPIRRHWLQRTWPFCQS